MEFGDGSGSSSQNATKTYSTPGNYSVRLTVTNAVGQATSSRTLAIYDNPIASFSKTLSPTNGVAPLTVNTSASSTGNVVTHTWDWGDGNPPQTGNAASHVYNDDGNFTVSLTATNPAGSDTATQVVRAFRSPNANFGAAGVLDTLTVKFSDSSTGNIVSWLWDFGDGATSSTQNPSRTYSTPGNYLVTLTVMNPAGTSTRTKTVYADNKHHIPALGQTQGADGIASLDIRVSRIRNPSTDANISAPGGIGDYEFNLAFPPATGGNGVNIMAVRGVGPFDSPAYGNLPSTGGSLTVAGILPAAAIQGGAAPQAPLTAAQVAPRILGSASVNHDIVLFFNILLDAGGNNILADGTKTFTLRRGNARNDSAVDMSDALFSAQFRVGIRGAGEDTTLTHIVNGASVKLETTTTGEKLDMNDALFIAQYRVGLRNASFDWIA